MFAVEPIAGKETTRVLAEVLPRAVLSLPWPKSMKWADGDLRWVRPLHSIVAILDGAEIVFELDRVGAKATQGPGLQGAADAINAGLHKPLPAGNTTVGHRFMAPKPFPVTGFDDYRAKLKKAYVVLDTAERKKIIQRKGKALAAKEGLRIRRDDGLLDEVAGLMEWPVPLIGTIESRFMGLPPEVLTTSMRTHQRYFALETKDGVFAPRFLVVAGTRTKDGGAAVIGGNERVLRSRLSDAQFFWDQDRKVKLGWRVAALKDITFHAKLGTVWDKVHRVKNLAVALSQFIGDADSGRVGRAAELARADLTTGMVGEFPELQGLMGSYYATLDGEDGQVANAIADIYSPKGPDDRCPTAPVSVAVALADRLDTLVGFWMIDEKPTGSKDPFALRRAALGTIRLIVENKLRLSLGEALNVAAGAGFNAPLTPEKRTDLLAFFADRLKVQQRELGVRHDLISAVFALTGEDDLVRLLARVEALAKFFASADGADLLVAYRRAANIARIEEKKDGKAYSGTADATLFRLEEERTLSEALATARSAVAAALGAEKFRAAMGGLAKLRGPVDAFFDKVTVNAEEPALRANRLTLLTEITATLEQVADFSRIEG